VCEEVTKAGDGAMVVLAVPDPGRKQQWVQQCSLAWLPIPLLTRAWLRRALSLCPRGAA